ncbi:MAG: DUF4340 domain-containing protein [Pseudomonadota bacterium]
MNAKVLTIFAVITLLVVGAAIYLSGEDAAISEETGNTLLFPELKNVASDISEIQIQTKDDVITLARDGDNWGIQEKQGYPAKTENISKLLTGMAYLETREAKTSNAELYSKLGVEDVSAADAQSVLVRLKKDEDAVAALLVGNNRPSRGGNSLEQEVYVRKPDEEQSWLAAGSLSVDKAPMNWLEKEIVNVASARVRSVLIEHADGGKVDIFKDAESDSEYQLRDVPEDSKLKAAYELNSIAGTLGFLNLDDVAKAEGIDFTKDPLTATFETFDGLKIKLTSVEQDGKRYAQFTAEFVEQPAEEKPEVTEAEMPEEDRTEGVEEAVETETTTALEVVAEAPASTAEDKSAEIRKEAEDLNARTVAWAYVLPGHKFTNLDKKYADLIEKKQEEKEEVSE